MMTKKYQGAFFNDYVEVTCFIKTWKVKQKNVMDVISKTEDLLSKF